MSKIAIKTNQGVQITVLSPNWKIILFDDLVNLDLKHHGRTHTCTAATSVETSSYQPLLLFPLRGQGPQHLW